MKRFFLSICLTPLLTLHAHEHLEVGESTINPKQLGFWGPAIQYTLYVPAGELFSGYIPNFPGGYFADELSFTTEAEILNIAQGADPEIELVSVTGPAGGFFSFWDVGAVTPTWSRISGWTQSSTDRPSFPVILGGIGHIHGRAFSTDRPGDFLVVFRARDRNSRYAISTDYLVTFRALNPPPLTIRNQNGQVVINFNSRKNLVYDLEICTDLTGGVWSLLEPHTRMDGTGGTIECPVPIEHPRAFFRLIEYK
jgi:hypothetical protein